MASLLSYVFKHCASEIAPVLQMLFTQSRSLNTATLPENLITTNIIRKAVDQYPQLLFVVAIVMEHIVFHSIMQHVQNYGIASY